MIGLLRIIRIPDAACRPHARSHHFAHACPAKVIHQRVVMQQHRFRFLLGGISVGHQEGGLLPCALYLSVDGVKAVYHPFHLCRDAEIIHRRGEHHHVRFYQVRTEFLKVIVENTWPVHAATVAGAARLHLLESTVEAEHLVPLFFRTFDELLR